MTSRKGDPDLFNTPRDPNPYLNAPPPPGPAPGSATFPFSYFKVAIITYIGAERRGSRIFRIFWNRVPVVWPAGSGIHSGPRPAIISAEGIAIWGSFTMGLLRKSPFGRYLVGIHCGVTQESTIWEGCTTDSIRKSPFGADLLRIY